MIGTSKYMRMAVLGLGGLALVSCRKPELTLLDVERPMTFAVAPALNHSGSTDFDPIRVADLMASELTFVPGVKVLPVNRVLAQLESEGKDRIESPAHALQVKRRLGVDSIIVFAITEYDPYSPPTVGISAQVYGEVLSELGGFDPLTTSKRSAPQQVGAYPQLPRAEYQRVFHGSDEEVKYEIRRFARFRDAEDSPYGWRKFLASQENYLRFCFHVTLHELIRQEVTHVVAQRERNNEVEQR